VILICSGAYVEQDLTVEVGRIPPAFLPIGNRRLYEYQVELLSIHGKEIYLSIPASYDVPRYDLEKFKKLNVTVIKVPDGLSLGNSIVFSWSASGKVFEELSILHGDTLFLNHDTLPKDSLSVHPNEGSYHRAQVRFGGGVENHYSSAFVSEGELVVSGMFRFSQPQKLMQAILENNGDFIRGLQSYSDNIPLSDIETGVWLDFGHLNSFFNSRSKMTTQRAFNSLRIDPRQVTKLSEDKLKMQAESGWFNALPRALTLHTPALLDSYSEDDVLGHYTLEYLYLLPLNDLMVFGRLSTANWRTIISAAANIIKDFKKFPYEDPDLKGLNSLYLPKTLRRLSEVNNWDFANSLKDANLYNIQSLEVIAKEASNFISPALQEHVAITHGDFCFSNILYDSRTQSLKLIDPRGLDANQNLTIYGDQRYDVAKFFHSLIAGYDYIIAGRYIIEEDELVFYEESDVSLLYEEFKSVFGNSLGFSIKEIIAINVHLFLSMLPLHADRPDRQKAMLLNAHQLFNRLVGESL
jgi:hypothetical protein